MILTEEKKTCRVEECDSEVLAKGYCCRHYYQVKRHGQVVRTGPSKRGKSVPCSEQGCGRVAYAKGLCSMHYQQAWRTRKEGSPRRRSGSASRKVRLERISPDAIRVAGNGTATRAGRCSSPRCRGPVFHRGACRLHYIKLSHGRLLGKWNRLMRVARGAQRGEETRSDWGGEESEVGRALSL